MTTVDRDWQKTYASHEAFYEDVYGHLFQGSHALGDGRATFIETAQTSGDFSDAPTPDIVIAWLGTGAANSSQDLGAGRFSGHMVTSDVILIPPNAGSSIQVNEPHLCRAMATSYGQLLTAVNTDEIRIPSDGDFGALHSGFLRDRALRRLLDAGWDEASAGAPNGSLWADGFLLQLASVLLRLRDARSSDVTCGGLAPWQVRLIIGYMEENLAEDISLGELAALLNLSNMHVCRAFKKSTGSPPHRWRFARRMERARELLETTLLPITEVAAAVGYDDPSQLSAAFRKTIGVSPSVYRKERCR